jgi:tellurite resistance protein TehA-like permease
LGVAVALGTWAAASTAIPFLVVAELRTRRWRYEVARWSSIFPLGMYGVASHMLGGVDDLAGVRSVGTAFFGLALAAWLVTAVGLARTRT